MPPRSEENHGNNAFTVRPATSRDRGDVQRLVPEGVLPGHVDYETQAAERIAQALGSDRERFFVAEANGRIIGFIAVVEASPDVGHLHWLRVAPQWQSEVNVARRLVRAAAEHARDVGLLKLAMHAPTEVVDLLADYYHRLGFEFSRTRDIGDVHVLEFYLNLYDRPEIGREG